MKKVILLNIVLFIGLFCSCSNHLDFSVGEVSSSENLAERYMENMFYSSRLVSRAITEDDFEEDFFSNEIILNENGNPLSFSSFSQKEKKDFIEYWKTEFINQLESKLDSDKEFYDLLKIENECFEETVRDAKRSVIPYTVETFGEKLFSKFEARNKNAVLSVRKADSEELPSLSEEYNRVSLGYLKSNYKKGRMVICKDTSSSSASSYIGHSSMMKDYSLPSNIYEKPMYKSMITSYPLEKNMKWPDKTDGVQYEPTVYWVSTQLGANNVSIVEAQRKVTVVGSNGKNSTQYEVASEADANSAVNYAENQLNKPYDWQLWWKYDTTEFYCSSLLWRAWYETNKDYSFNSGAWITPAAIESSAKTKLVKTYKNR